MSCDVGKVTERLENETVRNRGVAGRVPLFLLGGPGSIPEWDRVCPVCVVSCVIFRGVPISGRPVFVYLSSVLVHCLLLSL